MSPYPKNIGLHKSSTPHKQKSNADVCRRSSQQDDDSEDDIIDVESIDPVDILLPSKTIGEGCKPKTVANSPDQKALPIWKNPMMQNSLRTASSIECDRLPSVSAWVSSREVRKKFKPSKLPNSYYPEGVTGSSVFILFQCRINSRCTKFQMFFNGILVGRFFEAFFLWFSVIAWTSVLLNEQFFTK